MTGIAAEIASTVEALAASGIQHLECPSPSGEADGVCQCILQSNTAKDLSCSGMSEEGVLSAAESLRRTGLQKRGYVQPSRI